MENINIGTSGYDYGWFSVPKNNTLKFYSRLFRTLELNSSFYKTPTEKHCTKLLNETSNNFVLSVKIQRYITHNNKLSNYYVDNFIKDINIVLPKVKCILFQFPERFAFTESNFEKLKKITYNPSLRYAFEFRHHTWYNSNVYNFFATRKQWTIVIYCMLKNYVNFNLDTFIPTSDFLYIRFHGSLDLYIGYHSAILDKFVKFIRKMYDHNIKDSYVYFNNTDASTNGTFVSDAIYDANLMKEILIM